MASDRMTLSEMQRWAWNPDINSLEMFEDIASWFYVESGYLRPGKSYPDETLEPEDRQKKWDEWRTQKARDFVFGLRGCEKLVEAVLAQQKRFDTDSSVGERVQAWAEIVRLAHELKGDSK